MTQPLDVIRVFHNAFRNDMERIDAAALDTARGKEGLAVTVERFRFFNEVLVWHADGEEEAVFPRLEEVAPLVAEPYVTDHRGLDSAFDELDKSGTLHATLYRLLAPPPRSVFISISTWIRRIPISTGFSRNESPCPSKGRRSASWQARSPRNDSRKWSHGCFRWWDWTIVRPWFTSIR